MNLSGSSLAKGETKWLCHKEQNYLAKKYFLCINTDKSNNTKPANGNSCTYCLFSGQLASPLGDPFLLLHLSLIQGGHWGTTADFTTSFLHFSLLSTDLWDLANSRPAHSLILSSHLFKYPRVLNTCFLQKVEDI